MSRYNGFSVEIINATTILVGIHNDLPLYEVIDGNIVGIAIVETPAHGVNFVADESNKLLIGPVLIPDDKIYKEENGESFFIYYSAATINHMVMKSKYKSLMTPSYRH